MLRVHLHTRGILGLPPNSDLGEYPVSDIATFSYQPGRLLLDPAPNKAESTAMCRVESAGTLWRSRWCWAMSLQGTAHTLFFVRAIFKTSPSMVEHADLCM